MFVTNYFSTQYILKALILLKRLKEVSQSQETNFLEASVVTTSMKNVQEAYTASQAKNHTFFTNLRFPLLIKKYLRLFILSRGDHPCKICQFRH